MGSSTDTNVSEMCETVQVLYLNILSLKKVLVTLLSNSVLKVLVNAVRREKEVKDI